MPNLKQCSPQLKRTLANEIRRELERRKTQRDENRERCIHSFGHFIRQAWNIVEPAKPLIDNWHIDAIADHLQAVAEGKIRFLLINIGPGYGKSLISSVCFSAWLWTRNPRLRILAGTYATILTERDNIKTRMLVESEWYQSTFIEPLPPEKKWRLTKRNENHLQNDKTGFRMALSVDSVGTGLRGDGQILDDILNVKEAHSEAARIAARRWVFETMSSRFDDMRVGWRVAIGQRLHEQDPYGEMLASGLYEHLNLPTEFESKRRAVTKIGFTDPRKEDGELLFPELFTPEVVKQAKSDLGSYGFAGQHQQNPSPAEGGIFKRHWWRYWQYPGTKLPPVVMRLPNGEIISIEPVDLPTEFAVQLTSWDMAFKDTKASAYVVGQAWGQKGANRFLLDQLRDKLDFVKTQEAVEYFSAKHDRATAHYVEDKANGPAIISALQDKIPGLIPVSVEGSKEARAAAESPTVEAGNVFIPHPAIARWVDEFVNELATFPNSTYKDQTDTLSQALYQMRIKSGFFVF